MDFEQEITKLREQIRETQGQEAHARSEADALVGRMRESGTDLTAADNFAKVDEAYKSADSLRDDVAGMRERLGRALELAGRKAEDAPNSRESQQNLRNAADVAVRLLESDAYTRLRASGVLRSRNAHVNMDPVEVMTRDEFFATGARFRTTFDNSANIGSGLLEPDYTRKLIEQFVRRVRLLDVITIGTTDTDTVDYVIENARTDAAAETAYGTAVPESGYGFSHEQTTVKRVGHFYPATKGILADAGQTRTLLDSRLRSGLERRVEAQVLSGDGIGENILGIASDTGWGTQALGADTRVDAVHKAMTVVRLATETGIEPNVIGISPSDYEQVVLQKDVNGNYQMANPVNNSAPTIWGLTPVVSTLFADGTPWVGDFSEAATMWLREGVTLSATDSHADFFLKGLVAVMAETRLAFKLVQPKALCKLTGF